MIAGGRTVLAFNTVEDMEAAAANLGASDDGTIAIVFDYSETETNDVEALLIYEYDDDEEEFVEYYDGDEVSFISILDAIVEQDTNYTAIQSNATAGATHALINNGSNPHSTNFASIVGRPNTVSGYGITDAATLDETGKVPAAQLPSYVDDVIEGVWVNSTTFTVNGTPIVGETGKIYVSISGDETHKTFRFTGTQFVEISISLALGNTSGTAFRGDLGEQAFNNAAAAFGWGNHGNFGYLTGNSSTITNITNFANNTANNVANINNTINGVSNNLSNLGNTVSDVSNLVNTINGAYLTANSTTITNLSNEISSLNNAVANKVETSTTIANIALSNNISAADLVANLPVATNLAQGVMSAEDKTNLDAIQALMGSDEDDIVNKITEVLDVFENYPEGTNIVTALGGKLDANFANIANWDDAYSWGDHADVGYLTAESDTLDSVVNRGSVTNNATINYITTTRTDFNTTATDGYTTGQVGWDADSGTLSVGLLNGTTTKVGQQTMYYVQADETLTTGDVVQFNGVAGFKPKVKKAVASEINNMPSLLMGFVTGNIGTGNLGYVTSFGLVRNINTANFGNEGQILYYDSNTSNAAGKTTTTVPTAPNAKIELASVVREATGGSSNGELLIRVGSATSLAFDSSVELANVVSGEVLAYNGTAGRWENAEVVSLGLNVATSNLQNGQYLRYADGLWVNDDLVVYGSVNSVGLNMPTGFTVTNSPITNSGTLGVTYAEGYSLPTNATQDNWNAAFGYGNHQAVGYIVGLADNSVTTDNIAAWNGTTGKLLKDGGIALSSIGNVVGAGTVVSGNLATFNGTTGAILAAGYSVETTLTNNATVIPTSSAVTTYVDAQIGDIETILDSIIGGD
jgi:archaellum component FlaC